MEHRGAESRRNGYLRPLLADGDEAINEDPAKLPPYTNLPNCCMLSFKGIESSKNPSHVRCISHGLSTCESSIPVRANLIVPETHSAFNSDLNKATNCRWSTPRYLLKRLGSLFADSRHCNLCKQYAATSENYTTPWLLPFVSTTRQRKFVVFEVAAGTCIRREMRTTELLRAVHAQSHPHLPQSMHIGACSGYSPSRRSEDCIGSTLKLRDLRQVVSIHGSQRPSIEVRRNCILVNIPTVRCIILHKRVLFIAAGVSHVVSNGTGAYTSHSAITTSATTSGTHSQDASAPSTGCVSSISNVTGCYWQHDSITATSSPLPTDPASGRIISGESSSMINTIKSFSNENVYSESINKTETKPLVMDDMLTAKPDVELKLIGKKFCTAKYRKRSRSWRRKRLASSTHGRQQYCRSSSFQGLSSYDLLSHLYHEGNPDSSKEYDSVYGGSNELRDAYGLSSDDYQLLRKLIRISATKSSSPFEFAVLECIFIAVCIKLADELKPIKAHTDVLHFFLDKHPGSTDKLQQVAELRRKLYNIHDKVKGMHVALKEILDSEDGLRKLEISRCWEKTYDVETEKKVTENDYENDEYDAEILLECYEQEVECLLKTINRTDTMLDDALQMYELHLATVRNNFLKGELSLDVVNVVLGFVAAVGSLFGMNIRSGLEDNQSLFWFLSYISLFLFLLTAIIVFLFFKKLQL